MVKTARVISKYYKYLIIILIVIFSLVVLYTVFLSLNNNNSFKIFNNNIQKEEDIKNIHKKYKQALILLISKNITNITDIIQMSYDIYTQSSITTQDIEVINIYNYHKKIQSNTLQYIEKLNELKLYTSIINCYKSLDIDNNMKSNINKCKILVKEKSSPSFPKTYDYLKTYEQYWNIVIQLYENRITDIGLNKQIQNIYKKLEEKKILSEEEINIFIEYY